MGRIDDKLTALGLTLPAPTRFPEGMVLPFSLVNVKGTRVLFSGHPKSTPDGGIGGPYGQLGSDLTTQDGYDAARDVGLAVLANIKAEIGDLDRITSWTRVFGMVNSAPGFSEQHLVINGFSDLIIALFGKDAGRHARSAIGTAGLPMNFAIEIEGEVEISG